MVCWNRVSWIPGYPQTHYKAKDNPGSWFSYLSKPRDCGCALLHLDHSTGFSVWAQEAPGLRAPNLGWLQESCNQMFLGIPKNWLSRCDKEHRNLYLLLMQKAKIPMNLQCPQGAAALFATSTGLGGSLETSTLHQFHPTPQWILYPSLAGCCLLAFWISTLIRTFPLRFVAALWANTELRAAFVYQDSLRAGGLVLKVDYLKTKISPNLNIALEMKNRALILFHPASLFYLLPDGEWEGSHPSNFNLIRLCCEQACQSARRLLLNIQRQFLQNLNEV